MALLPYLGRPLLGDAYQHPGLSCSLPSVGWRLPGYSVERPSIPGHSSTQQLWRPQAHTHTLTTRWVPVAGRPSTRYSAGMQPHSCICIQLSGEQTSSSGVHHASPSTSAVTWFPSHICIQLAGETVTLGMWVPIIQRHLGCRAHWPQHHSRHTSQEARSQTQLPRCLIVEI